MSAQVEDHIGHLEDSGLERFSFINLEDDSAWLQIVMCSADLVSWVQRSSRRQ